VHSCELGRDVFDTAAGGLVPATVVAAEARRVEMILEYLSLTALAVFFAIDECLSATD
jgi:hypothetical protein